MDFKKCSGSHRFRRNPEGSSGFLNIYRKISKGSNVSELSYIRVAMAHLRARLSVTRNDEGGYSTEAVVVTALLVVLAIAAVGIISVKVIDKANGLQTG